MKAIASLAFSMASAVGICIGAGALASYVMAEPAERATGRSAAELWTLSPIKVERGKQDFERLPPQLSTYAMQQPRVAPRESAPQVAAVMPQAAPEGPSPEHQAWCRDRYRSYDAGKRQLSLFQRAVAALYFPLSDSEQRGNCAPGASADALKRSYRLVHRTLPVLSRR